VSEGRIGADELVVCVLTGHGLKDPDVVSTDDGLPTAVAADPDAIRAAIGL
jgi:threonine synthase